MPAYASKLTHIMIEHKYPLFIRRSTMNLILLYSDTYEFFLTTLIPHDTVAFVQPTNEAFAEYPPLAFATLEPFGGKVVMRCMTDEDKSKSGPEFIERSTSDFKIGIAIEFPSVDKAMGWKNSDEYQKIINKRLDNSSVG